MFPRLIDKPLGQFSFLLLRCRLLPDSDAVEINWNVNVGAESPNAQLRELTPPAYGVISQTTPQPPGQLAPLPPKVRPIQISAGIKHGPI